MGRQAAVRLLDAMVREGIAYKDQALKRYRVGLLVYEWGCRAVAPYLPSPIVRQEIAALADDLHVSVFYSVLERTSVIALERTDKVGELLITLPYSSPRPDPYHWATPIWGKVIAAFMQPDDAEHLLSLEVKEFGAKPADVDRLREELQVIRQQKFVDAQFDEDRYAVAAPVLDNSGHCSSCVVAVSVGFTQEQRENLVRKLTDAVSRASYYVGYSPMLLSH
jgi:DNA-binding IclR family transcriptional regulator